MSVLSIVQPLPLAVVPAASSAGTGLAALLTPNPREPFVAAAAGTTTISLDLGAAVEIDTVLLGFTNAPAGTAFTIQGDSGQAFAGRVAHSYRRAPVMRHAAAVLGASIVTRNVRIVVEASARLIAGVVAVGKALRPGQLGDRQSGHEWGSGRPIVDSGRAERLLAGFGTQEGSVAGGWSWTMPLADEEAERLYAVKLDTGTTGSILVLEHADTTALAFNEAVHWGKFTKLEPWTRQGPGDTRWALQVQDW